MTQTAMRAITAALLTPACAKAGVSDNDNALGLMALLMSIVAALSFAATAALWRWFCRPTGAVVPLPAHADQLAFLASGAQRATDVVLVELLIDGSIQIEGKAIRRSASLPASKRQLVIATRQCRRQLQLLRIRHARLQCAACNDELLLAIALFGIKALAGTQQCDYLHLRQTGTEHAYIGGPGCADARGCGDQG